jgi:hypothetical protein
LFSTHPNIEDVNDQEHVQEPCDIDKDIAEIERVGGRVAGPDAPQPGNPIEETGPGIRHELEDGKQIAKIRAEKTGIQSDADEKHQAYTREKNNRPVPFLQDCVPEAGKERGRHTCGDDPGDVRLEFSRGANVSRGGLWSFLGIRSGFHKERMLRKALISVKVKTLATKGIRESKTSAAIKAGSKNQ